MRVFNVPASAPFLRSVIAALVDGRLIDGFTPRNNPERLAQTTLVLPTRRAGRMAREVFLDVLGLDAAILPRIITLGAIDDDEAAFAAEEIGAAFDIPPAFGELERRLLLAQMIAAWAKGIKPDDPAQAPLVVGGPASTLALA
ncbi:MAG TPA: double-strand break repair protein AddB, partial [Bradyrhizobium sp.]|nr:double-strand break repair protein AddB [Bradyrhizobium sp.]